VRVGCWASNPSAASPIPVNAMANARHTAVAVIACHRGRVADGFGPASGNGAVPGGDGASSDDAPGEASAHTTDPSSGDASDKAAPAARPARTAGCSSSISGSPTTPSMAAITAPPAPVASAHGPKRLRHHAYQPTTTKATNAHTAARYQPGFHGSSMAP